MSERLENVVGYSEELSATRQRRLADAEEGADSDGGEADATMVDAPAEVDADATAASAPSDLVADEMPAWLLAAETALRGDEAPQSSQPREADDTPPWLLSAEVLLRDSPAVAESTTATTTPQSVGRFGLTRRSSSVGVMEFPGLVSLLGPPVMSPLVALKQREPELDPSLALD